MTRSWPPHNRELAYDNRLPTCLDRETNACWRPTAGSDRPWNVSGPCLNVSRRLAYVLNRPRNVFKPAVNMSRRRRTASNPTTTGRNPTTTGLKSRHFSRPPCRGCKTPCPVRATITAVKRRTGTFVRRTKRTGSDFCLNSKIQSRWKIARRSLTVVHAQGRMFPVVVRLLSRWYTDRPTVCNRL